MIVFIAVLVVQETTAVSWISQVHAALHTKLHPLQPSARPMMRPMESWKRLFLPTVSLRQDDIDKKEHHTNATTINATESVTVSVKTSLSWIDHTMARVVSIITYFAIGQSVIHLLHANRSEITTEVRRNVISASNYMFLLLLSS